MKKMLRFVDVKQETPVKRGTTIRKDDFNEIYNEYITEKLKSNLVDVPSAGFLLSDPLPIK